MAPRISEPHHTTPHHTMNTEHHVRTHNIRMGLEIKGLEVHLFTITPDEGDRTILWQQGEEAMVVGHISDDGVIYPISARVDRARFAIIKRLVEYPEYANNLGTLRFIEYRCRVCSGTLSPRSLARGAHIGCIRRHDDAEEEAE